LLVIADTEIQALGVTSSPAGCLVGTMLGGNYYNVLQKM
jgi:hypothetical protein